MRLVFLLHPDPALVFGVRGKANDLHRYGLVAGGADYSTLHFLHGLNGRKRSDRCGERGGFGGGERDGEGAIEE